jgi:hypothetical protein
MVTYHMERYTVAMSPAPSSPSTRQRPARMVRGAWRRCWSWERVVWERGANLTVTGKPLKYERRRRHRVRYGSRGPLRHDVRALVAGVNA